MSGSDKSGGDWGRASESLFEAARADHDASPRDRMRVAEALARRLQAAGPTYAVNAAVVSKASTRAGGLVSVSGGLKVALVVVLTVGSIALLQQAGRSPVRTADTPVAAPAKALPDARAEVEPVRLAPEALAARPPMEHAQAAQTARSENTPARRHVLRTSRPAEKGHRRSLDSVQSTGTATLQPNAPEAATKPDLAPSSHAQATGDSAAAAPGERTTTASAGAVHEASARARSASTAATDGESAAADARAEIAWFERIHAALRAGQTARARALCDEHEQRWPQGVFAVEREGVRALTACVLHSSDAAARARAFLRAYPRTALSPRVVAACGEQHAEVQK